MSEPNDSTWPTLGRRHHQRLREVYRSAGWPCHDALEVDLLAAGLLQRVWSGEGHEHLRVTDAGIACLARVFASHRAARGPHEDLVEREAPRREVPRLPFHLWMALAKAGPAWRDDEDPAQRPL